MKQSAFRRPLVDVMSELCTPCGKSCHLRHNCASLCSIPGFIEARKAYWGDPDKAPITDRERAKYIVQLLRAAERSGDTYTFTVEGKKLCMSGYLRLLGVMVSTNTVHCIVVNKNPSITHSLSILFTHRAMSK